MKLSDFYPELEGGTPVAPVDKTPQLPNWQTETTPFLRAPLPLPIQYAPDTLRQTNRPGYSVFRTSITAPAGIPAINSASTSAAAGANGTSIIGTPVSISLDMPKEFEVDGSPVGSDGTFTVTWEPEAVGTVLAGPIFGNPDINIPQLNVVAFNSSPALPTSFTISAIPTVQNTWALLAQGLAATVSAPFSTLVAGGLYDYQLTTDSSVTATCTIGGGGHAFAAMLMLFETTGTATVNESTQTAVQTPVGPDTTMATAFTSNIVAGSVLIVALTMDNPGVDLDPISISDAAGNTWFQLGTIYGIDPVNPGSNSAGVVVWVAPNAKATSSSNLVTISVPTVSAPLGFGNAGTHLSLLNMANLQAGSVVTSAIPAFRRLVGTDLPFPGISSLGGVKALVPVSHFFVSGLGTDGGLITAQPDFSDLVGIVQISQGGTGTATPAGVIAGSGVTVTGSFPAQTVSITGGGAGNAIQINGSGVSEDKLIYINGVQDGSLLWQIKINGVLDGG